MHLHALLGLAGLPTTSASLLQFLANPHNVHDLLGLVRTTQAQCHPCDVSEFTDLGRLGHVCHPAGPAYGPSPPPRHATVLPVPDGCLNLTKVIKLKPP